MNTAIWIYDFFNLPFSAREHKSCPFATWESPVVFTSQSEALCFIVSALLFFKVVWPVLTFARDDEDCACYSRWGQYLLWRHSLLFLLDKSCLCIFWLHLLFCHFYNRSLWSSGINMRQKVSSVLWLFVALCHQHKSLVHFFSLCFITESIKKTGPLSQIILLSAQPLCKVSYVYHNSYASFHHLWLK